MREKSAHIRWRKNSRKMALSTISWFSLKGARFWHKVKQGLLEIFGGDPMCVDGTNATQRLNRQSNMNRPEGLSEWACHVKLSKRPGCLVVKLFKPISSFPGATTRTSTVPAILHPSMKWGKVSFETPSLPRPIAKFHRMFNLESPRHVGSGSRPLVQWRPASSSHRRVCREKVCHPRDTQWRPRLS